MKITKKVTVMVLALSIAPVLAASTSSSLLLSQNSTGNTGGFITNGNSGTVQPSTGNIANQL